MANTRKAATSRMASAATAGDKLMADFAASRKVPMNKLGTLDRQVGVSPVAVGESFTLSSIGVIKSSGLTPYIGITTEEGRNISLRSLMGVSSMEGWTLTPREGGYLTTVDAETRKTVSIQPMAVADFNFKRVWQPPTRSLLGCARYLADNWVQVKGKHIQLLGFAVREVQARSDSPKGFGESWNAGDPRVMTAHLWELK